MISHENGPPGWEVGPRPGHHSRTEDTNNTINSKANGTRQVLWPQEFHADLGLTDDGAAVGL